MKLVASAAIAGALATGALVAPGLANAGPNAGHSMDSFEVYVCYGLDNGYSIDRMVNTALQQGGLPYKIGLALRDAVTYRCPEHTSTLDAWVVS